ncbi:unnamed protein product [Dracunculus medinensis]|uniref:Prefoldin subunit 4 n=1 Tax=Dracunculus medinensis TaxID=318479 RepID=A0A0N4U5A1_DRAME|nr:unnamed protein product [Dracunculus medinensis]
MNLKVHVTADDQKLINRFARLHQQWREKLFEANKDLENSNDASDELLLLDDSSAIPMKLGSIFIHYDQDSVNNELESLKDKLKSKINQLSRSEMEMQNEMNALKSILYGKFGNSINLETDKDD